MSVPPFVWLIRADRPRGMGTHNGRTSNPPRRRRSPHAEVHDCRRPVPPRYPAGGQRPQIIKVPRGVCTEALVVPAKSHRSVCSPDQRPFAPPRTSRSPSGKRPAPPGSPASSGSWLMPATVYPSLRPEARSSPSRRRRGRAAPSGCRGSGLSCSHISPPPEASTSGFSLVLGSRAHVGEFQRVGIADRRPRCAASRRRSGRGPGLSTSITPRPRPGLVWFQRDRARAARRADVIVTGGKVVAKVRRVTSIRPPTDVARKAPLPRGRAPSSASVPLSAPARAAAPPPSMPRFPQPQVIRQKLRHAAFADAVEDHQRPCRRRPTARRCRARCAR